MRWLVLVPVLATGCSVYAQQRAALVPHATPLPTDGQPLLAKGELSLGTSNAADPVAPRVGNPDAGIAIPSTQVRGAVMIRATPDLAIGGVYERGLADGAHAIADHQPKVRDDVSGVGLTLAYSIPLRAPGWRLGLSTELLVWSVPWVQYTTCIQSCIGDPITTSSTGADTVPTLAIGITPSYRTGWLTVFGGATARNHPTVEQTIRTDLPMDPEVSAGVYNITLHAGAEVELGGGVRASLIVHQTITRDPVRYGPSLGAMLTIPLGRDEPAPLVVRGPPGSVP